MISLSWKKRKRERESKRRKKSDVPDFSFLETNRSTSRNRDGLVSLSPMVIRLIERKRSQRNVNGGGASLPRRIVIRANFPASVLGSIGGTILSDERQRHLFFRVQCSIFPSPSSRILASKIRHSVFYLKINNPISGKAEAYRETGATTRRIEVYKERNGPRNYV